jgi:hypothetical protein
MEKIVRFIAVSTAFVMNESHSILSSIRKTEPFLTPLLFLPCVNAIGLGLENFGFTDECLNLPQLNGWDDESADYRR